MAQAIKGKIPVLIKVVFELRYRQGYTYLDRCGRTINLIQEYHPEWILAGSNQPNPQMAPLIHVETGAKFSFSSLKLDIGLERPLREGEVDDEKIKNLADQADELTSIVIDQLGLAEFTRLGFRIWYLFPSDTREDARQFMSDLGLFDVRPKLLSAFAGEQEETSAVIIINGQDRKFRFATEVTERTMEVDLGDAVVNLPIQALPSEQRKKARLEQQKSASRRRKYPPFATMIDIDAYREDPAAMPKPSEFMLSSLDYAIKGVRALGD